MKTDPIRKMEEVQAPRAVTAERDGLTPRWARDELRMFRYIVAHSQKTHIFFIINPPRVGRIEREKEELS
ncbi:MAG TPA: hypothetical protein ENF29_01320 [Candidatus Acetothermia bacterium]|nr:hypothetical protein [Candidatus Acetothermia bacterium]